MNINKRLIIFLLTILFCLSPVLAEDKEEFVEEELPAVNPFLGGVSGSSGLSGDDLSPDGLTISSDKSVSLKNLKLSGVIVGKNKKFAIFNLPDGRTARYEEDTIISDDLMILDVFTDGIFIKMNQIEYSLDLNNKLSEVAQWNKLILK